MGNTVRGRPGPGPTSAVRGERERRCPRGKLHRGDRVEFQIDRAHLAAGPGWWRAPPARHRAERWPESRRLDETGPSLEVNVRAAQTASGGEHRRRDRIPWGGRGRPGRHCEGAIAANAPMPREIEDVRFPRPYGQMAGSCRDTHRNTRLMSAAKEMKAVSREAQLAPERPAQVHTVFKARLQRVRRNVGGDAEADHDEVPCLQRQFRSL